MNIRKIVLALLLVFLTGAPAGSYVYRFTEEGARNHWETNGIPVPYYINQNGTKEVSVSEFERVIKLSFQAWQDVPLSRIEFTYQGLTTNDQRADDGRNIVGFDSYISNYDVPGSSVVGITVSSFYPRTGEIVDADIIFNDKDFTFTTTDRTDLSGKKINLQDVATHEIGHLIGLDHTYLEQATMYPFARDGQRILQDDDIAGAASLYPEASFDFETDSLSGTVKDDQGQPILGIYVSAIRKETGEESVAAISGSNGFYSIRGLKLATSYYLKARSVDLSHLGYPYQQQGDPNVYIPEYYDNASRLLDAQSVITGPVASGLDFALQKATILASYDRDKFSGVATILTTPLPVKDTYYLAVRFPASSLPAAFNVFGMTFFNNDDAVIWPRIILASGTETQPDLTNPLRQFNSYIGQELGFSTVEWESMVLTYTRTLWVVFQMPNSSTFNVGVGPGIGTASVKVGQGNFFYSTNNGANFVPHNYSSQYDPLVYLTVALTNAAPVPVVQLAVEKLDFGKAKVRRTTVKSITITNAGNADLTMKQISSHSSFKVPPDSTKIPAGSSYALQVSFTPVDTSLYKAIITLVTNDPTRQQIDIAVSGQGAYPSASLTAQVLVFGEVRVDSSADRIFYVRNAGPVSLGISGFQVSLADFRSLQDSVEVASGDSVSLSVRFTPHATGAASGLLTFSTDDPAHAKFTVSLSGTGIGSPVKSCDYSGDGVINILDAIAFLLGARANPTDPRYDWNGDGKHTLADAVALILDIRNGTCPTSTGFLASAASGSGQTSLDKLTSADIEYLEAVIRAMGLERNLEGELLAALSGFGAQPASLPKAFTLSQNRPNPFNPSTAITFTVPEGHYAEHISLRIYDLRGRLVRVLIDDRRSAGVHTVYWDGMGDDGRKAASGIYIYRLEAPGVVLTKKMVLLK